MMLGFSDARISIAKRGQGCRGQGEHCVLLGPLVCPVVYELFEDGYEMEMLSPLTGPRSISVLKNVYGLLLNYVWYQRPSSFCQSGESGWLPALMDWSMGSAWTTQLIRDIYPREPVDGYSRIHGDPTLANVMMRDEYVVVIDPMPRMAYRTEIPNRIEVDYGKMIQSACGWERQLGVVVAPQDQDDEVVSWIPEEKRSAAYLWAAIHLARVARRAPGKGLPGIASWAMRTSIRMSEKARDLL